SDQQLAQARTDLAAKSDEVADLQRQQSDSAAALNAQRSRLEALRTELDALRANAQPNAKAAERVAALEAEQATQTEQLASSQQNVQLLNARLATMQADVTKLKTALDTAAHERERAEAE